MRLAGALADGRLSAQHPAALPAVRRRHPVVLHDAQRAVVEAITAACLFRIEPDVGADALLRERQHVVLRDRSRDLHQLTRAGIDRRDAHVVAGAERGVEHRLDLSLDGAAAASSAAGR